MGELQLISAAALLTPSATGGAATLLRDAGMLVEDGKIAAIGGAEELRRDHPGAVHTAFGDSVLTPGLVNAHCHLELSYMRNVIAPPPDFGEWIVSLLRSYPPAERLEGVIRQAVREGVDESLRSGVTTIGDISRQCRLTREVLGEMPMRMVSFGEVAGLGWGRRNFAGLLEAAIAAGEKWKLERRKSVGLSPHAPYTIEGPLLEKVVDAGERQGLPVCMHLAELAEEREFLALLSGPLRKPYDYLAGLRSGQAFDAKVPTFDGGPVQWAEHFGLLSAGVPVLLAHGNYVSDEELGLLADAVRRRSAPLSVAYCPRTWAYFGHDRVGGAHRLLDLLACGVNVCLATDSLASNPDLCLLREAQFLHRLRPEVPVELLFGMITIRGARALGLEQVTGSLTIGKDADFLTFSLEELGPGVDAGGLLARLIERAPLPHAIYICGARVG